jgi:exodeoxyribonuclease-3
VCADLLVSDLLNIIVARFTGGFTMQRLISWNINGIRAAEKKGLLDYIRNSNADIVALQEIKAMPEQMSDALKTVPGYHAYFNSAERKGYSGTAVYTKREPLSVQYGLGIDEFDHEGRTLILHYPEFTFINIYYPNGGSGEERLGFKLRFYDAFYELVQEYDQAGLSLVICGDVNTAHKEIDLARPKENENRSGFMPIERAFLDRFFANKFVDTFRIFHAEPEQYTWWDMKTRARDRNIGWRIDYFVVNQPLLPYVKDAWIEPDVQGSDHCPIGLILDV